MDCLNCGAKLLGPHCSLCGQKHEPHPPTVGHLVGETFETLTHADSRLWRTLSTLLARPGQLTREWFAGHRASYLPPIRLYLVLSVVFFLMVALGAGRPGVMDDEVRLNGECTQLEYNGPFPATVAPKLREACLKVQREGFGSFQGAFFRNLPKAMFVLLPLVAVFMLLIYRRPRRLYVEHLLHLVHNQSAIYAAFIIEMPLSMVLPEYLQGPLSLMLVGYLIWYCYRSMRVYYGQPRLQTLGKYTVIAFVYLILALLLLLFTGLASVLGG
ncbi:MAG: DUF3667 domain-containing protein [Gammaproteobacteria bacterium]